MCYKSDFGLTEDESSCDEEAVTSALKAGGSCSASVDRLFVSSGVSTDAEEAQGQFQGV